MEFFSKLREQDFDGIFAGTATDVELVDIARFFREMRIELEEGLPEAVESEHLIAIFNEARQLPVTSIDPPPAAAFHRSLRLRNPIRRLATRATIAAVAIAALGAFGGAAYAGVLPTPVQGRVATIARHIGLLLPNRHHHSKPQQVRPGRGAQPNAPVVKSPGSKIGTTNGNPVETQTTTRRNETKNGPRTADHSSGGSDGGTSTGDQSSGGDGGTSTGDQSSGSDGGTSTGDQSSGSDGGTSTGDQNGGSPSTTPTGDGGDPGGTPTGDQSAPTPTDQGVQPQDVAPRDEQQAPSADSNTGSGQPANGYAAD